jgi:hypothetical protein
MNNKQLLKQPTQRHECQDSTKDSITAKFMLDQIKIA